MNDFNPPYLLRNQHIQSILNSIKLRKPFVNRRSRGMRNAAASHILDCGKGVRLQGYFSGHNPGQNDLCILIHGWEGSSESSYILSAAGTLWNEGFDVFRLNMRDHGPTHHLNEGLFHSCRIDEVVDAVQRVQEIFPHKRMFLAGFSLGGNFALRVAVRAPAAGIKLDKVAAICPVLYPPNTLHAMENGLQIYHLYFMKKWRNALRIKHKHFPNLKGLDHISGFKSISDMTDYFVGKFTDYPDMMTYLKGYAITGNALENLQIPSVIIASIDDPIIPAKDIQNLASPDCLKIETTRFGGHCGYLKDFRLNSWADDRLKELFHY
ncbi:MAG: alpha/beta fold hydrolase [Desulfobacteraceae bacterium]|nr:alpha/beta fold hydrolase [Desulfobacteraceae bacterium]MBC2754781.1 alpha/beta fold hydrolase [Desulfobacteraceae bacterium]